MNRLERALDEVVHHLEEQRVPYMVFGGIANLQWGRARLTEDVDVKVQVEDLAWDGFIAALGERFTVLPPNPIEFARSTHVVPLETRDGVRIDIVLASLDYERQAIARAVALPLGAVTVRLCTAEDLILHKIISDRPRDREDVEGVILRQRGALDRAYLDPLIRELVRDLERPEVLELYRECLRKAGLSDG